MIKVVALKAWSNGSYSMDEKTVAEIPDALANELIAKGVVAESPDYYGGGGSGGGVLVVHDVADTLDKTWQEIHDAMLSGGAVIQTVETNVWTVISVGAGNEQYLVLCWGDVRYSTSSASGYPLRIR